MNAQCKLYVLLLLFPACVSPFFSHALADPVVRPFQAVNFFPRERSERLQEKAGSWIYKAVDNPSAIENHLARGAALGALDLVGLDEPVKALVDELGDATEYEWGRCSEMQLRSSFEAETCFDGGARLEFEADYDLQGIALEMHWSF